MPLWVGRESSHIRKTFVQFEKLCQSYIDIKDFKQFQAVSIIYSKFALQLLEIRWMI